ncbi:hypothetical protein H6G91_12280 [Nostoc muscorum FACHB-395]|jgi:hypothetical protein|nr:hypothetical protein [Desmonostoc muscorum FACHB-395]
MSKYPFFIHSLLITPYFKALREARGFRPIFLMTSLTLVQTRLMSQRVAGVPAVVATRRVSPNS